MEEMADQLYSRNVGLYSDETWVERPGNKYPTACVSSFELADGGFYCRAFVYMCWADTPTQSYPDHCCPMPSDDRYQDGKQACVDEHLKLTALARMCALPGVDC